MLPFLKNRQDAAVETEDDHVTRKHDEDYVLLDACVDDMMTAFEKKDKKLLKQALEALCDHILSVDEEMDQQNFGEEP